MEQHPRGITGRYPQQLSFAEVSQLVLSFETPGKRQSASPVCLQAFILESG